MSYLLSIVSALLLVLCFPRWNLTWLAPVAVTPLLLAVWREPLPKRRFLLGWICGIVYWFGVCYWIQFVLAFHGGLGDPAGWAVFALFCLAKGLHMAFFALLARRALEVSWALLAVPALWVAIEFTHGFLGFAWLALGNAGSDMGIPLRLAPLTGVYGMSFVFMMMATAVAVALLRRPRWQLFYLAGLLGLTLLPHLPDAVAGNATAAVVQPNISETEQWTEQSAIDMQRRCVFLSQTAAVGSTPPDLIVWPEVPAPLYYRDDPRFRGLVDELARSRRTYVLLGTVTHTKDNGALNAAVLVSPDGEAVSEYDKIKLVPFGEFVPWPFGFANKISTEVGDFRAGEKVVVSPVGSHRIGTFICYESVFPHLVRQFVRNGAEVLFNLSNDGYFGKTAAREQHLRIVRMRATENRRWILRSTNDGITAVIDPAGRIRGELPPYTEIAAQLRYRYEPALTPYTRYGDWFAGVCAVLALLSFAGPAIQWKKHT